MCIRDRIEKEQSLDGQEAHINSNWQRDAHTLLVEQRSQQHEMLSDNLVELFER